jgi:hypothetical protein
LKNTELAAVIERDLIRNDKPSNHDIAACWSCGYTFTYRGRRGDLNGNFCSMRCQDWYDAGNARGAQDPRLHAKPRRPRLAYYTAKVGGHGHWQPSADLRALGFKSVDCGFDGPDAWARAE